MQATWEKVGIILTIGIIAVIPSLTVLAFRGWMKTPRIHLPQWQRVLGLLAILSMFLSWLTYVGTFLLVALWRIQVVGDVWMLIVTIMAATGILLGLALKSPSRPQILFSGLLIILLLWATVNV